MGTQQSGVLNLRIADVVRDRDILKTARFYAQAVLREDPDLALARNQPILATYARLKAHKEIWNYIS